MVQLLLTLLIRFFFCSRHATMTPHCDSGMSASLLPQA